MGTQVRFDRLATVSPLAATLDSFLEGIDVGNKGKTIEAFTAEVFGEKRAERGDAD